MILPYESKFEGEEVDALLTKVQDKDIYPEASESEHGLMSIEDKERLDSLEDYVRTQLLAYSNIQGNTINIGNDSITPVVQETDPTVPAHVKSITQEEKSSWNSSVERIASVEGDLVEVENSLEHVNDELQDKQDVIEDLDAIRSGASLGSSAYQLPSEGIPATDLTSEVQAALLKAETAVQDISSKEDVLQQDVLINETTTDGNPIQHGSAPNRLLLKNESGNQIILIATSSDERGSWTHAQDQTLPTIGLVRDKVNQKYTKPQSGIPAADLSQEVQTALEQAGSAIQVETDPVFSASPASGITSSNIISWNAKASSSDAIGSLSLSLNTENYQLTLSGTKVDGTAFTVQSVVDLPLESVVVNGSYDSSTKEVVLTLENGNTVRFSVADLVSGLQTEITTTNKLSADLVQDGTTNKVYTATEKSKLANIQEGAEVNVQSDWNASSGDAAILNKPTKVSQFTNDAGYLTSFTETDPVFAASAAHDITSQDITNWNSKQDKLIAAEIKGSLYRTNVSGSGNISITGTTGQFPTVTTPGTYVVEIDMQSQTLSYGLNVNFGSNHYQINTTNGHLYDKRQFIIQSSTTWSASVIGSVAANTILDVSLMFLLGDVTIISPVGISNDYTDLKNKPTIPTKVSQLQNDSGYITDPGVTSVNGQTGAVTLSIPQVSSALDDGGFITNGLNLNTRLCNIGFSSTTNLLNSSNFYIAIRAENSNPFIGLKQGTNLWYCQAASGYFYFGPTSSKAMRLDQDGNVVIQTGSLTAQSIIKSGGTSSQFLKADGSVDSNAYAKEPLVIEVDDTDTTVPSGTYISITTALAAGREVYLRVDCTADELGIIILPLMWNDTDNGEYDFGATTYGTSYYAGIMSNDTFSYDSMGLANISHTHGDISSTGRITTSKTIANGDNLVVTDSNNSNLVSRASLTFDGSTTSQLLSKKGTWEEVGVSYASVSEILSLTLPEVFVEDRTASIIWLDDIINEDYSSVEECVEEWGYASEAEYRQTLYSSSNLLRADRYEYTGEQFEYKGVKYYLWIVTGSSWKKDSPWDIVEFGGSGEISQAYILTDTISYRELSEHSYEESPDNHYCPEVAMLNSDMCLYETASPEGYKWLIRVVEKLEIRVDNMLDEDCPTIQDAVELGGFNSVDEWRAFVLEAPGYGGANRYRYMGETFEYNGHTYYLWAWRDQGANVYGYKEWTITYLYILTETIDREELYNMSFEKSIDNQQCPYVYKITLDTDEQTVIGNYSNAGVWLIALEQ